MKRYTKHALVSLSILGLAAFGPDPLGHESVMAQTPGPSPEVAQTLDRLGEVRYSDFRDTKADRAKQAALNSLRVDAIGEAVRIVSAREGWVDANTKLVSLAETEPYSEDYAAQQVISIVAIRTLFTDQKSSPSLSEAVAHHVRTLVENEAIDFGAMYRGVMIARQHLESKAARELEMAVSERLIEEDLRQGRRVVDRRCVEGCEEGTSAALDRLPPAVRERAVERRRETDTAIDSIRDWSE